MLSDASADLPATAPIPAVAERRSASRRVRMRFENSDMKTSSLLLGQCILAINVEVASRDRCCCVGLTAADADRVIALSDDRVSFLGNRAEVARLQIEVHFLACARIKMDALKTTQSNARSSLDRGEFKIELNHFVTCGVANIGDRDISAEGLACGNHRSGNTQVAIAKLRVA